MVRNMIYYRPERGFEPPAADPARSHSETSIITTEPLHSLKTEFHRTRLYEISLNNISDRIRHAVFLS